MTTGNVAVRVRDLSKEYRIGLRFDRYKTLRESLTSLVGSPARLLRRRRKPVEGEDLSGRSRTSTSTSARRGRRHHRPQRRRQEHAAEDPVAHHRADRRHAPSSTAASASLLEVGTGFHPELTGRENIYLNGAILGMRRAEIDRQVRRDRRLRRGRASSSTRRSSATRAACTCGWRSPSPRTSSPRS